MKTLYLHIGTPKTGTSAIQFFCKRNRRRLRRHGYCFPKMPFFYPIAPDQRNGHFLIAGQRNPDGSFADPRDARDWRKGMRALAKCFRKCDSVILTDESIWNSPVAFRGMWRDLKAESEAQGFDVRIIVYLRRQDQFLTSIWEQRIKVARTRWQTMPWEEILPEADEKIRLNYYEALEGIAAHFGRERITVRIYDRERFPGRDIIRDFLQFLGLPFDAGYKLCEDRNPSLYGGAAEIKRILNGIPGIRPDALRHAATIAQLCCAAEEGAPRPSMFSEEERREFLQKYEASNRLVARDYFGDEDAPLFPEPRGLGPKWDPRGPEMYESIVRFFGIAMFAPPRYPLPQLLRHLSRKIRGLFYRR